MAKYSISEVGDMLGTGRQYVNTYKTRGKIFIGEDGLFDTEHPMNKMWYVGLRKKYLESIKTSEEVIPKSQQKANIKSEQKPKERKTSTIIAEQNEIEFGDEPEESMYTQKARAELDLKLLAIKKAELDIQQKEGKLLNIDVAKDIVASYMSSYSKGLFRDMETWMHRIMDIHKIPLTEKVNYTNELETIMNAASSRTMKEVVKKLESENAQL